jgi:hypothetical protein
VQLKSTIGRRNSRVRLSLSSVDRLAKDAHPSVIGVFRAIMKFPLVQYSAVVFVIFCFRLPKKALSSIAYSKA